jgi:hypothetical protein
MIFKIMGSKKNIKVKVFVVTGRQHILFITEFVIILFLLEIKFNFNISIILEREIVIRRVEERKKILILNVLQIFI